MNKGGAIVVATGIGAFPFTRAELQAAVSTLPVVQSGSGVQVLRLDPRP